MKHWALAPVASSQQDGSISVWNISASFCVESDSCGSHVNGFDTKCELRLRCGSLEAPKVWSKRKPAGRKCKINRGLLHKSFMQSWLIGSISSLLSSDCQGHVFVQGKSQNSVGGKSSCQVSMLECPLGVWPISTKKSVSRHKWWCQHQSTRECGRFTAFMNSPLLLAGISAVVVFLTCCSVMLACGLDKYSMLNPAGVLRPTNFSFASTVLGWIKRSQWLNEKCGLNNSVGVYVGLERRLETGGFWLKFTLEIVKATKIVTTYITVAEWTNQLPPTPNSPTLKPHHTAPLHIVFAVSA